MDGCQVMASGSLHPPAIITPMRVISSCNRREASQTANNNRARRPTMLSGKDPEPVRID
jgi:hypothetical protein